MLIMIISDFTFDHGLDVSIFVTDIKANLP